MRITAKADYAVRAAVELAAAEKTGKPVKGEYPGPARRGFRRTSSRTSSPSCAGPGSSAPAAGADGGYQLARPADDITVADVLRAVEGPLAAVQGIRPDQLAYGGAAERLPEVWVALRASLRDVLEHVTLADIARGKLPAVVKERTRPKDAWRAH